MISEKIYRLRQQYKYSQEKFAEKLNVSRQAVQRWESGNAIPDMESMLNIAKTFQVSLDWLNDLPDHRMVDELRRQRHPVPSYQNLGFWNAYAPDLLTDFKQFLAEGKDVEWLREIVLALCHIPQFQEKEDMADILYKIMYQAPTRADFPYREPDDLESIRLLRVERASVAGKPLPDAEIMRNKLTGAWLGRVCGCMLGQPIEGIHSKDLDMLLRETDNYPMHRYITREDVMGPVADKIEFPPLRSKLYANMLKNGFPGDDDTNYTCIASSVVDANGRNFASEHICRKWTHTGNIDCYATAEKVAYRNIIANYAAPATALYKNPFREWIGAQIRGDYFGYINPGDPEAAAEMAWRDARVSHSKNGIYGEMLVAAMNAAAMVCDDPETVILCGMSQIPSTSRLYEKLQALLDRYHDGGGWDAFYADFMTRYDEKDSFDAVHVISNAELVVAALLWGACDYSKTICLAVQCGFDTDCNGATAGSVAGMIVGVGEIDPKWTDPIDGKVGSSVFGPAHPVEAFVDMMLRHIAQKGE